MKKSKTIKLVLITSLIGSGGSVFGHAAHNNAITGPFFIKSNTKVRFADNNFIRTGYYSGQDSVKSHPESGSVTRGGWGFFGRAAS
jgi:hypothetical protein